MRLHVEGEEGELAARPGDALAALADLAAQDGADQGEWLTKALKAHGASQVDAVVGEEPAYAIVTDACEHTVKLYDQLLTSMLSAIKERLERAAREADTRMYSSQIE